MSATGRVVGARGRPEARSRSGSTGGLMMPSLVNRSMVDFLSMPSSRATGTPRSVMMISSPHSASSIHRLSWARNTAIPTSMPISVHKLD